MANVSLQPAPDGPSTDELIGRVERGLYVVGDKSWSIDMQRFNFQFTGQRFYKIADGELVGQVRDVAYQATTTDFWNSMEAVGGPETWVLGGAFNCGKAQPGQVACGQPRLPDLAVPRRPHPQHQRRGRPLMNAPRHQSLVEHALVTSTADDCIVIVRDRTSANLRWANNTLTTNGVMHRHHRHRHLVHPRGRRRPHRLGHRQRHHGRPGRRPRRGGRRRGPGRRRRPRTPTSW